jgi:methyl-accepting chemotaxis protein
MLAQFKLRGRIIACTIAPLLMCAILAGLFSAKVSKIEELYADINRSQAFVDNLGEATLHAIRMERSMRGYLINRKPRHRQGFEKGSKAYKNHVDRLAEQIELLQDAKQRQRFREYRKLGNELERQERQMLELASTGNLEEAVSIFSSDRSSEIIRNLQALYEEFTTQERKNLAAKQATTDGELKLAKGIAIWGTVFGSVVILLLALQLTATIRGQISRTIAELVTSASEVAARVERRERAAVQQASSVSQTTTSIEQLSAYLKETAQQAEFAACNAHVVLGLVDDRQATLDSSANSSPGFSALPEKFSPRDRHQNLEFFREEEMTDSSRGWAGNSRGNAKESNDSRESFPHSAKRLADITLKQRVQEISDRIQGFTLQVRQIDAIAKLVSNIAAQTNILALNASVEAARGGDAAKGFRVVAVEIRKLANETDECAQRINSLVTEIETATHETIDVTQLGTQTLNRVIRSMNEIAGSIQQISSNSQEQAIAIQQIFQATNALNQVAKETAEGMTQDTLASDRLNETALNLKRMV